MVHLKWAHSSNHLIDGPLPRWGSISEIFRLKHPNPLIKGICSCQKIQRWFRVRIKLQWWRLSMAPHEWTHQIRSSVQMIDPSTVLIVTRGHYQSSVIRSKQFLLEASDGECNLLLQIWSFKEESRSHFSTKVSSKQGNFVLAYHQASPVENAILASFFSKEGNFVLAYPQAPPV